MEKPCCWKLILCFNTTFKYTEIFWIILHFQSRVYFSSVSKRPFKTFWTFLNIILNKPYHLWMPRMDLIKTKKVPCLHVSRCWISFLKCQHNLEGAEKKEARKKTHTHKQKMWFMRKKKDDFPVTQYSILCFGLQTKFTILEQQITITVICCYDKVNLVWRPKKWYWILCNWKIIFIINFLSQ